MTWLAWAFFLATSWTWSIGLFLPVILQQDAGTGAWAILLVCNVVGAASFGLMIGTRQGSEAFLQRNARACRVFSVVTILGQAWFMGWVVTRLPPTMAAAAFASVAVLLLAGRAAARWQGAAMLLWGASIAALVAYVVASPDARLGATLMAELTGPGARAFWALPLLFAGFAFSPYLDLTFHRAMQDSGGDTTARWAFAAGFPVLFGSMLVFSLAYRDELAPWMLRASDQTAPAYLLAVLVVLLVQAGFTMVLHLRHLPPRSPGVWGAALGALVVAYLVGDRRLPWDTAVNEFVYRSAIGFYGVMVPCWLWATRFGRDRPGPAALAVGAAALGVAALPMLVVHDALPLYVVAFALMAATRLVVRRAG